MSKPNGLRAALRGKRIALAVAAAFLPWENVQAQVASNTLPTNGSFAAGTTGTIHAPTPENYLRVDQSSTKGIINWGSFSIGSAAHVHFNHDAGRAGMTLNRVVGNEASQIFGRLSSTGQIFLVNNAGVLFAPGAAVDVGALLASSLSITDQNFLNGNYQFYNPGNAGSVTNAGSIITSGGFTALLGPQVRNDGVIMAHSGKVALAAGNAVSLAIGDNLISVVVDEAAFNASVFNTGALQADGGTVLLKASSMNGLLDTVINTSGVIRAAALVERNGEIVLEGNGAMQVAGTLQAGDRIRIAADGALNIGNIGPCCVGTFINSASQEISASSIAVGGGSQIVTNAGDGTQTITTPGTLLVRGGTVSGTVGIFHNGSGEQRITAGNIAVRGGLGTGTAAVIAAQGTGEQLIETSKLEIFGSNVGAGGSTGIIRADLGDQTVTVSGDITIGAGTTGDALLQGSANGLQTVRARNITMANGLGGTNSFASLRAGHQDIHATGNVTLTGGATGGTNGGVRIGGLSGAPTDIALTVDGELRLKGGSAPDNSAIVGPTGAAAVTNTIVIDAGRVVLEQGAGSGARIGNGSSLAAGTIDIRSDTTIELNGTTQSTSIRTLGDVKLDAASITQASGSFVRAGTLTLKSTGDTTLAGGNQVGALATVAGTQPGVGGKLEFNNATGLNVNSKVESSGAMKVTVAGELKVDASTQDALLRSSGGQTVEAHSIALTAQNGRKASIENTGGDQTVKATAGGMKLEAPTAFGVAQITNSGGLQSITASGQLSVLGGVITPTLRNSGIFNIGAGLQTVKAGGIVLQGGSSGTGAAALINSQANQEIDVAGGDIEILGGNGGVINNAAILASPAGSQTIVARNIKLENGTGGVDTVAAIQAGHQLIDITGDLTLTAKAAVLGSAAGGPGVRIGAPQNTLVGSDITLLVDGSVTLNGGTVADNGAAIGSSGAGTAAPNSIFIDAGGSVTLNAGNPSNTGVRIGSGGNGLAGGNISIKAGGAIELKGTQRNASIRTSEDLKLDGASITESGSTQILARTLTTKTTSGETNLASTQNDIQRFDADSAGAVTLTDLGALQVLGIKTTNDAITLTTDSLTSSGVIDNGGGTTSATIALVANAFNLAGGQVLGGNAAVALRPRNGANLFGIESAGTTTLTNADIASIETGNFLILGSAIGNNFTGNMLIGQNARVEGGGKNLAFFRSLTAPGTTTIGLHGVTTGGDVIVSAGGGAIQGSGGVIGGDEVQLRASQGIGTLGRVNTAANALTIGTNGSANVSEADDVTMRTIALNVAGNVVDNTTSTSTGGRLDLAVGGALNVAAAGIQDALVTSNGQSIVAQSINVSAQDGRSARILNNGLGQSITAGSIDVQTGVGGGTAEIRNNTTSDQAITVTGDHLTVRGMGGGLASIVSAAGNQTIAMTSAGPKRITLGDHAALGASTINSGGDQTIRGFADISLTGGSGLVQDGSNALILAFNPARSQTIEAGRLDLANSVLGGNNSVAAINAATQTITTTGDVTLTANASGGSLPGVRIGGLGGGGGSATTTNLLLNVGRDLILTGGTLSGNGVGIGSTGTPGTGLANTITIHAPNGSVILNSGVAGAAARIGSSATTTVADGDIRITAGGEIRLNGGDEITAIRTRGTVTLDAASISEGPNGVILAGTLDARTSGHALLTGANQVSNFTATSSFGDVTFNNSGLLNLGTLSAAGAASVTNGGDIVLGAPVTAAQVALIASGGSITEAGGSIAANSLTTVSSADTTLNGANQVGVFDATSTGGDVTLNNSGALNVTGMSAFGDATITNLGDVTVSGPWSAGGTSAITVGSDILLASSLSSDEVILIANDGSISEIGGAIVADRLTTVSSNATSLGGENRIGSYSGAAGSGLFFFNRGDLEVTSLHAASASVSNNGAVTVSGPWVTSGQTNITAFGFGASLSERAGGFIQASGLNGLHGEAFVDLNGANRISGTLHGSSLQGDFRLTNAGDLNFGAFAFSGDVNLANAGALNVTSMGARNVTVTNSGPMSVSGIWTSQAATSITTAGDLTITNNVFSSGPMSVHVDGALTVAASGVQPPPPPPTPDLPPFPPSPNFAMLVSSAGQEIVARSIHVLASDGGSASITNQMSGNQTITATGGGLQVRASGGAPGQPASSARIDNSGGIQTINVVGGPGLDIVAQGGSASLSQNTGAAQNILLVDADHIKVNGVNGIATVSAGGAQTISIAGSGANALMLGEGGNLGFSQIFGATQAITAGEGGQAGSITISGANSAASFTGISSAQLVDGTQTLSTSGTLRISGGAAFNTPPAGSSAGVFHNGGGAQTVKAASLELNGGTGGVNNGALIVSSGGAGAIAAGNQVIDVSGQIALQGGSGGGSNSAIISSSARQTVLAGSIVLQGGSAGSGNNALISSSAGAEQFLTVTGTIRVTGGDGGAANRAGLTSTGAQTITGNPDIVLKGGAGGNGNNVFIQATSGDLAKPQTIHARSIELRSGAGIDASATVNAARNVITTTGDVSIFGSAGQGGANGARIGGIGGTTLGPTNLTLSVGGDLLLHGGTVNGASIGSSGPSTQSNTITVTAANVRLESDGAGARIGASNQTPLPAGDISVTADGDLELGAGTAIRTAGTVTLDAATISEAANGRIIAGTLNIHTIGDALLTGPNEVASFTAATDMGNVSFTNIAPVLTLGSMDLPASLSIDQSGDLLVGTAAATAPTMVYADGDISVRAGGSVIVRGSDVTPLGASALLANGNLQVAAGSVTIQGGAALATPAAVRGQSVSMTLDGNLAVTGGSGHFSPAVLSSGSNIDLTVGGQVRVDAGSGYLSLARVQTEIRDGVIHITFPNLGGGYFVNGVEGDNHHGQTGFFTLNKPAKLGSTLLVDYGT